MTLASILILCSLFYIYTQYFRDNIARIGEVVKTKPVLILFDFDGVICNSYYDVISVFNENAKVWHYNLLKDAPDNYRNVDSSKLFEIMNINKIKLPFLVKKWRKSLESRMNNMKSFEGTEKLISSLKANNISIGMVTSNAIENVKLFLSNNNLDKFDFIYSGTGIFSKDRIFRDIIARSHIPNTDIYYIGDETRDILAGKKAGINTISVTWGFQTHSVLESYKPDYLVASPQDLIHLLLNLTQKERI